MQTGGESNSIHPPFAFIIITCFKLVLGILERSVGQKLKSAVGVGAGFFPGAGGV